MDGIYTHQLLTDYIQLSHVIIKITSYSSRTLVKISVGIVLYIVLWHHGGTASVSAQSIRVSLWGLQTQQASYFSPSNLRLMFCFFHFQIVSWVSEKNQTYHFISFRCALVTRIVPKSISHNSYLECQKSEQ